MNCPNCGGTLNGQNLCPYCNPTNNNNQPNQQQGYGQQSQGQMINQMPIYQQPNNIQKKKRPIALKIIFPIILYFIFTIINMIIELNTGEKLQIIGILAIISLLAFFPNVLLWVIVRLKDNW